MKIGDLAAYGASAKIIETLSSTGLQSLYPPQAQAVKEGLLTGEDSFVIAAPTASGKTLIVEMAALKVFFETRGKVIYLVPLRALAREKFEDFKKKYTGAGIRIVQSTGDFDSADPFLNKADWIISTNEKMDSLIRHRAAWLNEVGLVIADEIHLLADSHRGPTLEVVLTRLRSMIPSLRILALSATIPNAEEIAAWLDARLIESGWRPVPLREGVYFNDAAIFNDGSVEWIPKESRIDALDLAIETIKDRGQALIFVNTRKSTEGVAGKASPYIAPLLTGEERESLGKLSARIIGASAEPTRLCRRLAKCVSEGVAFHHAGISSSQRRIVEDAFRANQIKLVAATTTLAMGLNLPSRRVIIRDWWRYESGLGIQPIPVIEIKQMSGRAGRPGYDEYGEAILIARNKRDEEEIFDNYIRGEIEKIESRLANKSALRTHILASIAGGFTKTKDDLIDFLKGTFFASRSGAGYLSSITEEILDFLRVEEMILSDKRGLAATRFGRRVSELYIDPVTGVILRDALKSPQEKETFPLLHMIAHTPDMMVLKLKKREYEEMVSLFYAKAETLLIQDSERYPTDEILSEIKTASLLMEWILESPEDKIAEQFGVGPGDIHTMVELSDWLLYSAGEIGTVFGLKEAVKALSLLRTRVAYGVREELLKLVSLRGIGRIRGRALFEAGYRSLQQIRKAAVEDLAKVPGIGMTLSVDIKKQVQGGHHGRH